MKYPAYSDYVETDVPWIGRQPSHWKVMKLNHMARLKSGSTITSADLDENGIYPVYGGNGIRGTHSHFTHDGDHALIGRQGAECGNINYAQGKFWASEHAVVVHPDRPLHYRWLGETLRAMDLNQYSQSAAQPGLSVEVIGRLKLPFPPLEEQKQIADFLDWRTDQIDALIAKKQGLLERLSEKRSTLITQAVTRGMRPNVELRETGSPWIPKIPAHWTFMKFGHCTSIAEGQVNPEEESFRDLPLVAPNHIEAHTGKLLEVTSAQEQGAISGKYLVRAGDLVYSKIRPHLNKCALIEFEALCSADAYPIRTDDLLLPQFLKIWMLARPFLDFATESSMRVAMPKINRETLNAGPLAVPPVDEQMTIVAFIETETNAIDRLANKAELALKNLFEYRSALITAAVTGQIDVRGVKIPVPA